MAKDNNLKDYLTDLYEGIKTKNPNASRNPQDFRTEIESISTGIEGVTETDTKVYVNTEKNVEIGEKPKKIAIYNQDYTITNYGQNATLINWGSIIGENFLEENIKKGVNIFGKTGTYESDGIEGVTEKNGTIYIGENSNNTRLYLENTNKLINDVGIGKDQVNVSLYSHDSKVYCYGNNTQIAMMGTNKAVATNLSPENIKKDVNILGVVGTYDNAIEGVTEQWGTIKINGNTTSSSMRIDDTKSIDIYGENSDVGIFKNASVSIYQGNLNISHVNSKGGSVTATNLEPQNIKKDVNILGVIGTFEGGTNTSDATATASDILLGKTAYGADGKMEGIIETYDGENEEGQVVESTFKMWLNIRKSCAQLFSSSSFTDNEISKILKYNDTENVTTFDYMFYNNSKITIAPQMNTSNATSMRDMFEGCSNLVTVPQLDTSNVTSMYYMFDDCYELQNIPKFNTSKVSDYRQTFYKCRKLKKIDISYYRISTAGDTSQMCYECNSLKALIIRSFGNKYNIYDGVFYNCYHILGTVNDTYNPNGDKDGYIYVPRNMVDTLKSATNWSTYGDQIRALEDYTKDGTTTGEFDDAKAGLV